MERTKQAKARSKEKTEEKKIAGAQTAQIQTSQKTVGTRGRIFEGIITKKFPKRIVLEFERMVYVRKYERYARLKTKLHARLPDSMQNTINVGDLVRVHECRPLSKIIHFVVIEKIKDAVEVKK